MSRGNLNGFAVSIERSLAPEKIGEDASTTSAPWIPRISREILRDLGMSDECHRPVLLSVSAWPIGAVRPNGPAQTWLDVS
jgi:hypothetical protein